MPQDAKGSKLKKHNVKVDEDVFNELRQKGFGNASLGIRLLLGKPFEEKQKTIIRSKELIPIKKQLSVKKKARMIARLIGEFQGDLPRSKMRISKLSKKGMASSRFGRQKKVRKHVNF